MCYMVQGPAHLCQPLSQQQLHSIAYQRLCLSICRCACGLNVALILLFLFLAIFNFLAAAGQFAVNCLKASTMIIDHEMRISCVYVQDHFTVKSDFAIWQLITVACPAVLAKLL